MLHCLIFVFQNLFNFWEFYFLPFLSLSFITSMALSYSDCGTEFNKWLMNISSSILCPVFANSVHFFSRNANQSIGILYFPACNSGTWYKLPLCPLLVWDSTSSRVFPRLFFKSPLLNLSDVAFSTNVQ